MNIKEAQLDMRFSYLGGSPGVISSGAIWLTAGITAVLATKQLSVLVFFFGGMLIHPLGILISKLMKRTGKHKKENPLSNLAMESTLLLFIGLFMAYSIFRIAPELFYSIMLLTIGGRYVLFQTIYGMREYWALGIVLIAAGTMCLVFNLPFYVGAIAGGGIELIFSIIIFRAEKTKTII